jgi:outer membrane protein assembly factor BamA
LHPHACRCSHSAGRLHTLAYVAALILQAHQLCALTPSVVGHVTIDGATVFTPREILSWMILRPGVPYSSVAWRNDSLIIIERFRVEGYLDADVKMGERFTVDSSTVDLAITIDERRRTVLGSLRVTGNSAISSEELLGLLDSRAGLPVDQGILESDVAVVLSRYEQRGYPLSLCTVDSLMLVKGETTDSVSVTLVIDEGPRVNIEEIRVEGNRETATRVVLRESRIRMGEPYNPDRMQTVRQRLLRLNIFSSVSDPELYLHNDKGGVLIRVQEGSTNTFDGIAGYMPGNGVGDDGYFTGLASVSMRNLFGTARKMHFRWQKEDRHSQELAIGYVEPWLFNLPLNVGVDFQQRRQDTSHVRQGGSLRAEWMLSEVLAVSLIGSTESVIPSADSTIARVPRSSTTSAGVEVVYDTRDDLYSPTAGARYRADFHYGRKVVNEGPSVGVPSGKVQRFTVDLESYRTVFLRQVFALGIHGRQVEGSTVDESEFYRFGGANSLRGYRENQFVGTRVGWVNAEYRLLLARRSFVYGFLDAGYYYRPADELRGTKVGEAFQYGYGIGLRFDSPLGNLGVSFALGKGDSFAQGKVHFGILNEF